jgi:hypothetical protein
MTRRASADGKQRLQFLVDELDTAGCTAALQRFLGNGRSRGGTGAVRCRGARQLWQTDITHGLNAVRRTSVSSYPALDTGEGRA